MTKRIAVATAAVAIASLPLASEQAHGSPPMLSLARARTAIVRDVGIGTVIEGCRRVSRVKIRCSFRTPAINEGIETESSDAVFYALDEAVLSNGRVTLRRGNL